MQLGQAGPALPSAARRAPSQLKIFVIQSGLEQRGVPSPIDAAAIPDSPLYHKDDSPVHSVLLAGRVTPRSPLPNTAPPVIFIQTHALASSSDNLSGAFGSPDQQPSQEQWQLVSPARPSVAVNQRRFVGTKRQVASRPAKTASNKTSMAKKNGEHSDLMVGGVRPSTLAAQAPSPSESRNALPKRRTRKPSIQRSGPNHFNFDYEGMDNR